MARTKTTKSTAAADPKVVYRGKSQRLAHIFSDIDMRMSHTGLKDLLRTHKIKMEEGDFIVFINTARTMIKAFASSFDAILFVKNGENKKLDMGIIKYLPKYCNGPTLNLQGAVEENLKDIMKRRKSKKEGT